MLTALFACLILVLIAYVINQYLPADPPIKIVLIIVIVIVMIWFLIRAAGLPIT